MHMGCLQRHAPAAALALPVTAAPRLAAAAEAAAPALGGLARAGGRVYHVTALAWEPDIQPVLLEVALDMVDGEPLHGHELQDALGGCLLRPLQLLHRLHEARVQLRRPSQPWLGVLPLLLRGLCTGQALAFMDLSMTEKCRTD